MKHTRRRPTTTDPERRTQATGRFRRDRGPSPAQPRASGTRAGATHGCTHPVRAPRQMLILRGSQPLGASGRGRPRGPAERSAEAAEAATAAPATQGVAPTPLASSAARTEVPASIEEHTVSIAAGGMGRMGHWFEPCGRHAPSRRPPKAAPSRHPVGWRRGAARPAQRRPSAAPTAWEQLRVESAGRGIRPLHALGGGMAGGAGAHLLAVNEGVEGVLPARCDASSTSPAAAAAPRRAGMNTSKLEATLSSIEESPSKLRITYCHGSNACRGWSVGRSGARPPSAETRCQSRALERQFLTSAAQQ